MGATILALHGLSSHFMQKQIIRALPKQPPLNACPMYEGISRSQEVLPGAAQGMTLRKKKSHRAIARNSAHRPGEKQLPLFAVFLQFLLKITLKIDVASSLDKTVSRAQAREIKGRWHCAHFIE
jgi:hypothetical protein